MRIRKGFTIYILVGVLLIIFLGYLVIRAALEPNLVLCILELIGIYIIYEIIITTVLPVTALILHLIFKEPYE
jgi:hypothetical protein